jgi:hypothetical protein
MWMSFFIIITYHVTGYLLFVWIKFSQICWTIYILNLVNVHIMIFYLDTFTNWIHRSTFWTLRSTLWTYYVYLIIQANKLYLWYLQYGKHKNKYKDIFHGFLNNNKNARKHMMIWHIFFFSSGWLTILI